MEEKLEDKVLKKIGGEDVAKLAALLQVKIPGFRNTGGKIPEYLVRAAVKKYIKNVKKDFYDKIELEESSEEKTRLIRLTKILVDATNKENLEEVEEFLKEENENENEDIQENNIDTENEEINALKAKLQEQEVENKKIKREFRKEKERLEKDFQEEKKRLKEKIRDGLSVEDYNKVLEKLKNTEEEVNSLRDALKEYDMRMQYLKNIVDKKILLLVNMTLKEKQYFPYKFYTISSKDIARKIMPDDNVTDVWIVNDSFPEIHYTVLMDALETKYGNINIFEIDKELMKKLKIEVQQ